MSEPDARSEPRRIADAYSQGERHRSRPARHARQFRIGCYRPLVLGFLARRRIDAEEHDAKHDAFRRVGLAFRFRSTLGQLVGRLEIETECQLPHFAIEAYGRAAAVGPGQYIAAEILFGGSTKERFDPGFAEPGERFAHALGRTVLPERQTRLDIQR